MPEEPFPPAGPGYVTIRAYAELNDFLAPGRRMRDFDYPLNGGRKMKHLLESAGIPHTEIEMILLNGNPAGFDASVSPGDRISVYPVFESMDVGPLVRLRPEPLRRTRFVLDVHLGKLAVILRALGFDALFPGNVEDGVLGELSRSEERILLTCDRMLLKRNSVTHGCCIRSRDPETQAREVLDRLDLRRLVKPLSRCLNCSGELMPVEKSEVEHRLQPRTRLYYRRFTVCAGCGKLYWKGSHYPALLELLGRLGVDPPA